MRRMHKYPKQKKEKKRKSSGGKATAIVNDMSTYTYSKWMK